MSPVIGITVKDSLLVYIIKYFRMLASRRGSVVVRERD